MDCKNNISIDIIVPIYHGMNYIPGLIAQIETCAAEVEARVGLLLVNDVPEETLPEYSSDRIAIRTFNTEVNRGIQGARVFGIEQSQADYIVMLDQDDSIAPKYLKSQLEHIGSADAVVCDGMDGDEPIYTKWFPQAGVMERETWVEIGNMIRSPGQVLMKRVSIPEEWKQSTTVFQGADDWLLWMLMQKQRCRFAINPERLFLHLRSADNYSGNLYRMMCSEAEMAVLLGEMGCLTEKEKTRISQTIYGYADYRNSEEEKIRKKSQTAEKWIRCFDRIPELLRDELNQKNIESVAIYGLGFWGLQLIKQLEKADISISYGIDRSADSADFSFPVYRLEEDLPHVDAVILTIFDDVNHVLATITETIQTRYGMKCFLLFDLAQAW